MLFLIDYEFVSGYQVYRSFDSTFCKSMLQMRTAQRTHTISFLGFDQKTLQFLPFSLSIFVVERELGIVLDKQALA